MELFGLVRGSGGRRYQRPINYHELTYLEYSAGAFTNGKFSQFEQTNTKQVMARLLAFPFGSKWKNQGLRFTGFYDYG